MSLLVPVLVTESGMGSGTWLAYPQAGAERREAPSGVLVRHLVVCSGTMGASRWAAQD